MIQLSNPRAQSALKRAVIISLLTWRKANQDDDSDGKDDADYQFEFTEFSHFPYLLRCRCLP